MRAGGWLMGTRVLIGKSTVLRQFYVGPCAALAESAGTAPVATGSRREWIRLRQRCGR